MKRRGDPPPAGILKRPGPFSSLPLTRIQFPSGDQEGEPRTWRLGAKRVGLPPESLIRYSAVLPCLRIAIQIPLPWGEIAGGAISPPSLAFHNSVATPSLNFQR